MSATATSGLFPEEEARRKVTCYRGTNGMADHCESSVTATMMLGRGLEEGFKAERRAMNGR